MVTKVVVYFGADHPQAGEVKDTIEMEAAPPEYVIMTKPEFNAYGWAQVGMSRHQQIIEAARDRAGEEEIDLRVRAVYQQFKDAPSVHRNDAAGLATILVGAGIMTQGEADAYLGDWPAK